MDQGTGGCLTPNFIRVAGCGILQRVWRLDCPLGQWQTPPFHCGRRFEFCCFGIRLLVQILWKAGRKPRMAGPAAGGVSQEM